MDFSRSLLDITNIIKVIPYCIVPYCIIPYVPYIPYCIVYVFTRNVRIPLQVLQSHLYITMHRIQTYEVRDTRYFEINYNTFKSAII